VAAHAPACRLHAADGLLKELGMSGGTLGGLTQAVVPSEHHEPPAKKPENGG